LGQLENFKYFNVSEIFNEFNDKAKSIVFTEKIFYEKIFNQIVDLILFKFVELIIREPDYNRSKFLPDLKEKIEEIKKWIKLKGAQLHMTLTKGKGGLDKAFQANRKDTFVMGAAKKSKHLKKN
jgi:pentose-5-phosphate-3-epimerase